MISFDLETDLIARPVAAPAPVCIQWCDREPAHDLDASLSLIDRDLVWKQLHSGQTMIGHGVAYDFACLMAWEPDFIRPVFDLYDAGLAEDTLLNQKLLDIATGRLRYHKKVTGYDLGAIAGRHGIAVDKSDPWRLRYSELRDVPIELWPPSAVEYCLRDATAPWQVRAAQQTLDQAWAARMGSPIFGEQPASQARAALALHLASAWGVRTDAARCDQLIAKTEAYLVRAKSRLVRARLVRTDGSKDTKAAKAYAVKQWEKQGVPPPLTKTGQISLDADARELLGSPLLDLYGDYTTQDAIRTKVRALRAGDVLPLQAGFDPLLVTGRTSSYQPGEDSALIGMQLQNFHRKFGIRECIVARGDKCFISIDYNSAELHTLAQCLLDLFGYSRLAELLNQGLDVHLWFAAQVLGITYEEALARKKDPDVKGMRQWAKPCNFGFPGGMGAKKFVIYARSYGVHLTLAQARDLRDRWLRAFPEMAEYFRWVGAKTDARDTCTILHTRSGFWRGGCYYTDACNSQFQHLQAHASKAGLWEVSKRCYAIEDSPLYGFRIWNHVHDENIFEGAIERAHDAAWEGTRVMVDTFNRFVPDVPVRAEPALMLRWYKDAERAEDSNGRLIPWEPKAA